MEDKGRRGQPPHRGRGATARGREEEDVTKAGGGNLPQVRGATARGREDGEDDKGWRGTFPLPGEAGE